MSVGLFLVNLALILFVGSMLASPFASARPRGRRQRQQRRAHERVARALVALAAGPELLPASRVADVVAHRGRIVVRTHLMLIVPFAAMTIGTLLMAEGVLLRDFARSHGDVPALTMFRVLRVFAVYVLFLAVAVAVQQSVWNRHPDFFAAHHLLRALEQMALLRPDVAGLDAGRGDAASRSGGDVDVDQIRQDVVATLGQSARYVRRLVGRRLPFVGRAELADVRRRAAELAQAISGHQKMVVYGSQQEIVALIPTVAETLAALVEQRLGDLPGAGSAEVAGRVRDVGQAGLATAGPPARRPGEGVSSPTGRAFQPDDIELLRREIARIYPTSVAADQVLARVGYPREQRPNIDYHRPDVAWHAIFHDFEVGIVEDPYRRLLTGALETYGANVVLRDLARRYGVSVPPGYAPLSRTANARRWFRLPPV